MSLLADLRCRVCSLSNLCRTMARDNFANEMRPKVAAVAATTASEIRRCDDAGGRDGCCRSCWSVIVWDLETVPDLRGFAAANSLVGKTDAEVRALLGNRFPKHIYHSIVCIWRAGHSPRERSLGGGRDRCTPHW